MVSENCLKLIREWLNKREITARNLKNDWFHGSALVINNLHAEDYLFWSLISHPVINQICSHVLNQYSYNNNEGYSLTGSAIRAVYGHQNAQQLHIDSNLPGCNHILSLQFCIPVDSFTGASGATQVVIGSQSNLEYPPNNNQLNSKDEANLIKLSAEPGDILVFNAGVWHGSSNKSNTERRAGIFLNYSRWFLKQSFDIANNIPDNIYNKLNEDQLRIAGSFYQPPLDSSENRGRKSSIPIIRHYNP